MDHFKLINMNGRVYDPVLGQFLSPDPFIADPASTMSYNRYAYCNYNPLKYTDPSGYSAMPDWLTEIYNFFMDTPYGGKWSQGSGYSSFSNSGEAFGAGVDYCNQHNSWGYTYSGSEGGYAYDLYSGGANFSLTPVSINGYNLSHASKEFFIKYFSHFENRNLVKPTNWISWDNFANTASILSSLGSVGSEIIKKSGYNATFGIGTGSGRKCIYYHPSGWNGSNQYVWKTFGVAKSLGYFFYTGGIIIDLAKYTTGQQSGFQTGLNMTISTTSLFVGGYGGIAITGGYEYIKYMWDCINGYNESLNNLYRETYQIYWKETLYDPDYDSEQGY